VAWRWPTVCERNGERAPAAACRARGNDSGFAYTVVSGALNSPRIGLARDSTVSAYALMGKDRR
jgi:hypothetical protein